MSQRIAALFRLFSVLLVFSISNQLNHAKAEGGVYLAVGTARAQKSVIAFPELILKNGSATSAYGKTVHDTLSNDLIFMDLFTFLSPTAFLGGSGPDRELEKPVFQRWTGIGANFLIEASIEIKDSKVVLEGFLYEIATRKLLLSKRYFSAPGDVKALSHTFGNDIVNVLTGLPGIFLTRIAMVCDRSGKKEIFSMAFDGSDVRQITAHRSISFSPAWSPDGKGIAYSVYTRNSRNIRNIDLYFYDFESGRSKMLSNRQGINSGAFFNPANGGQIALTMSFLGNPEIFALDRDSGSVSRLTKSFGVDVDPAYSPDGKKLAFVSSRTGKSMIFKMNADGTNATRLTYAGDYNATPSWSPNGTSLVFAGWVDHRFDIFTMDANGSKIERLTKNEGNNEDPFYSPDGNFIAFSSNRSGKKQIYVINSDGSFVRRLTFGLGECTTPKWSTAK